MAKVHNSDVKSKRPKLSVLQKAVALSALAQNKLAAAILVGQYIAVKIISDIAEITDIAAIRANKFIEDSSSAIDSINNHPIKARQDISTASDSLGVTSQKVLTDSVIGTDDVGGVASVDDDQYMSFFKSLTDLSSVTDVLEFLLVSERSADDIASAVDQINILIAKGFLDSSALSDQSNIVVTKEQYDTLSLADEGYAFWQDYVDNPYYFAEDYIGTKQLFT